MVPLIPLYYAISIVCENGDSLLLVAGGGERWLLCTSPNTAVVISSNICNMVHWSKCIYMNPTVSTVIEIASGNSSLHGKCTQSKFTVHGKSWNTCHCLVKVAPNSRPWAKSEAPFFLPPGDPHLLVLQGMKWWSCLQVQILLVVLPQQAERLPFWAGVADCNNT